LETPLYPASLAIEDRYIMAQMREKLLGIHQGEVVFEGDDEYAPHLPDLFKFGFSRNSSKCSVRIFIFSVVVPMLH
jgi:hypothetical protein